MKFEWDKRKEKKNIEKHGIDFEEAKNLFYRDDSIVFDDPEHSKDEDRFLIVGFSMKLNLLVTCFCERDGGDTIRIISARKLTKKEQKNFSGRWKK